MSTEKISEEYLADLSGLVGSALLCMVKKPNIANEIYKQVSYSMSLVGVLKNNNEISELHDKVRHALELIVKDVSKK